MPQSPSSSRDRTTLSLRIGSWFEAHATGWAVLCVPLVVVLLLAAAWLRATGA